MGRLSREPPQKLCQDIINQGVTFHQMVLTYSCTKRLITQCVHNSLNLIGLRSASYRNKINFLLIHVTQSLLPLSFSEALTHSQKSSVLLTKQYVGSKWGKCSFSTFDRLVMFYFIWKWQLEKKKQQFFSQILARFKISRIISRKIGHITWNYATLASSHGFWDAKRRKRMNSSYDIFRTKQYARLLFPIDMLHHLLLFTLLYFTLLLFAFESYGGSFFAHRR